MQTLESIIFHALRADADVVSALGSPDAIHMYVAPDSQQTPMLTVQIVSDAMQAVAHGYESVATVSLQAIGAYTNAGQDAQAVMTAAQKVIEHRIRGEYPLVNIFCVQKKRDIQTTKDNEREQIVATSAWEVRFREQ